MRQQLLTHVDDTLTESALSSHAWTLRAQPLSRPLASATQANCYPTDWQAGT